MTKDNIPDVIREAESFLVGVGAKDPNAVQVKKLLAEGFFYLAISGFDAQDDEQRERITPAVQILGAAFKENSGHSFMLQAGTSAFFLLLAPTLDPRDVAVRLASVRDAIEAAYPGGGGPTIGLHLPAAP
ncbi:MAG TPA: hypothetical protein VGX23_25470 [Actinocrinis sp.]|nr:hypothetical protein [Actinocrinis sp.]